MRFLTSLLLLSSLTYASSLATPDISTAGIDAVKQWSLNLINEGENEFRNWPGSYRQSSPGFWGAEVIYSIQVDRFNDGNPNNNNLNLPAYQQAHQHQNDQQGLPDYRHGGDIQGITNRLDYLADLGITTIWVTPILKHDGSYHGYCTTDPTQIDPGFGSKEDFREMVRQAHNRGIRVVLDIVINHMCDPSSGYSQYPNHHSCPNELQGKYWLGQGSNGGSTPSQGQLGFSNNFFGPFKSQWFFSRCGSNTDEEMRSESDASVFGDFVAGMFDYDTRNWDFQFIFTAIHQYWMAYADIDGFRLDAAKHVTPDFLAYFSTTVRQYARSLNKNNFLIVGEVAASATWIGRTVGNMFTNPDNPNDRNTQLVAQGTTNRIWDVKPKYQAPGEQNRYPGMNAAYNMQESGTAVAWLQNVQGRGVGELASYFYGSDWNTVAAQIEMRTMWTCLELHDWDRFLRGQPAGNAYSGLGYLLTGYGTPLLYYGLEQGFNANCHWNNIVGPTDMTNQVKSTCSGGSDSMKRQDMFVSGPWKLGSVIPAIDALNGIGYATRQSAPSSWRTDPFTNTNHDLYKWTRKLIKIRKSCAGLALGNTYWRYTDPMGKLGIFSRIIGGTEVVVVVNPWSQAIPLPSKFYVDNGINWNLNGQKFKNLFNGGEFLWIGRDGASAALYPNNGLVAQGNSVMIFVYENNIDWSQWNNYGAGLCANNARLSDAGLAGNFTGDDVPFDVNGVASTHPTLMIVASMIAVILAILRA